jgi:hypothetical protein
MLAGGDHGANVDRPKARRRRQQDEIAVLNHLGVRVQADEDAIVRDIDLVTQIAVAQSRQQGGGLGTEGVADGDQSDVVVGAQALFDGAGTAAAAADQADANSVVALGVDI